MGMLAGIFKNASDTNPVDFQQQVCSEVLLGISENPTSSPEI